MFKCELCNVEFDDEKSIKDTLKVINIKII